MFALTKKDSVSVLLYISFVTFVSHHTIQHTMEQLYGLQEDYRQWLTELKSKIRFSQIKAAVAVNSELIRLYWNLGQQIVEKQENAQWGSGFIERLSKDLQMEFPDISGLSVSNLRRCR